MQGVVVVVTGGDGCLPTDGSTYVPDDAGLFSRGFRNIEDDVFCSIDLLSGQKSMMTPCRGRVKARRLVS